MFDTVVPVTFHTHVGNSLARPRIASDEFGNDVEEARVSLVRVRAHSQGRGQTYTLWFVVPSNMPSGIIRTTPIPKHTTMNPQTGNPVSQ